MPDFFTKPIFVLGLPRSGTSMVAGAFAACGAWTGTTVPGGGPENPKGFFEHYVIREQVTKAILTQLGCDPLGVRKLPPVDLRGDIPTLSSVLKGIIEKDGYQFDKPWLYKDAKLTLLWPIFKNAFPSAHWIIVKRDEEGFINSCLRTHFMNQHSQKRKFWKQFAKQYRLRLKTLKLSGANTFEVSTPDIINGKLSGLKHVINEAGLSCDEQALADFISPSYWHNTRDIK